MSRPDGQAFRHAIGVLCIVGGLAGFAGLYVIEVPPGNRDALMLALGLVMGWGGSVVQSEYGSTSTGRKVTDSAIRGFERQQVASEGSPQPVVVTNKPDDPVPTEPV